MTSVITKIDSSSVYSHLLALIIGAIVPLGFAASSLYIVALWFAGLAFLLYAIKFQENVASDFGMFISCMSAMLVVLAYAVKLNQC